MTPAPRGDSQPSRAILPETGRADYGFAGYLLAMSVAAVFAGSCLAATPVKAPSPEGLVDENAPVAREESEGPGSETARAAEASPLLKDADAVLSGDYAGVDTATLLASLQEKAKWGELSARLLEVQGILLWNRGDRQMALACLRRLDKPSPHSVGLLAEGALAKGDRYEAASLFLKAARASAPGDGRAPDLYRRHLELKRDPAVESELAARLEKLGRYSEASLIRVKDPSRAAADPAEALRVGAMLASQGLVNEALALYRLAIGKHPDDLALRQQLAAACEADGRRLEAGRAYAELFVMDPAATAARDRALAHLEASGAAHDAALRQLLETAVTRDPANARLRFKLAVACLAAGDRAAAHLHLSQALASDPKNPTYLSRLPETLEGDSLIAAHSAWLRKEYEQRGGSARLVELAARAYGLEGKSAEAGRAWFQLYTMAPQNVAGKREAVLALFATGDPAYLSIAGRLAAPIAEKAPGDREIALILLKAYVQDGQHDQASEQARQLLKAFPDQAEAADAALAAAKSMLAMEKPAPAQAVLADLVAAHPSPEASLLLGGILHAGKQCPAAVEHLEAAAAAFPVAQWMLGECLEAMNEPLRASLAYQAYGARTGDKEGLLALARVNRSLGDAAKESESLEALASKGWANESDKLRLGFSLAAAGDSAKAAKVFEELYQSRTKVPAEPAWVDAGMFLGARFAAEGKHDKAIRALSIALRADASKAAGWRLLGDCQVSRRLWKVAFESYAGAEAAGGSDLDLARKQLEVALKLDSKKDLAKAYAAVARHDPAQAEAHAWLAGWHRGERNYLDAAHHYRMLAKEKPEDAKAWEGLGNCLAMVPDLAAAGEPLQKAIDLGAESDEVYVNRARAYREEGSKDMAASILEFLLSRNPRSYLGLLWSAKFAEADGRPELAMEFFKKSSRLNPPRTDWPELASQGVTSASAGSNPPASP